MADNTLMKWTGLAMILALVFFWAGATIDEVSNNYDTLDIDTGFQDSYGNISLAVDASESLLGYTNESAESNFVSSVLNTLGTPVRILFGSFSFFSKIIALAISDIPLISGFGVIIGRVVLGLIYTLFVLMLIALAFRWKTA